MLCGREEKNIIEAAVAGASRAIPLVANIAANLIAFISILYFINATLTWFGQRVGIQQLTYQVRRLQTRSTSAICFNRDVGLSWDFQSPFVTRYVKPVEQPAASCKQTFNRLSNRLFNRLCNRFDNRFDNRMCRVYKHSTGCQTG